MFNLEKYPYQHLFAAVIIILAVGITFYHFVEHLSWLNAYYFSVITLATVGYGDITPKTDIGKIFTTLYVFAGVGVVTTFFTLTMKRWKERIEKRRREG